VNSEERIFSQPVFQQFQIQPFQIKERSVMAEKNLQELFHETLGHLLRREENPERAAQDGQGRASSRPLSKSTRLRPKSARLEKVSRTRPPSLTLPFTTFAAFVGRFQKALAEDRLTKSSRVCPCRAFFDPFNGTALNPKSSFYPSTLERTLFCLSMQRMRAGDG
jgi:hypothetical protein